MPVMGADCHAHLFGHGYPLDPERRYDPEPGQTGTVSRLLSVLDAHGLSHGLVVTAEPYGTDNSCVLEGIARSQGRLKGIALVPRGCSGFREPPTLVLFGTEQGLPRLLHINR